jgi:hypothetical protein
MSLLREFQRDYDAPLLITIPQGEGAWQDNPLERGSGRSIRAYAGPRSRPKRNGGVSCPCAEGDNGCQIFFIFLPFESVFFLKIFDP